MELLKPKVCRSEIVPTTTQSARLLIEPLDSLRYIFEIQALFACPTAMKYYENGKPWSHEKTLRAMQRKIERAKQFAEKGIDSLPWWVVKLKNNNFVGLIGTYKAPTVSAPGKHHIDVCCISKPEYWGQYIMFEAMAHLGRNMAVWLQEYNLLDLPIRFSTSKGNKASINLGKIFMDNKEPIFDMEDHPNGPRFRWEIPVSSFLGNGQSK